MLLENPMPAANSNPVHPLSPLQEGMLSHHAQGGAASVDLVQIVADFPEALPGAFVPAWHWLARRHAVLRTAFRWAGAGQPPVQEVHAAMTAEISQENWLHLDKATQEQRWTRLLAQDRTRGLNLAIAPLWRVTLVQLAPRSHRVLFTFHHLLLDGRALIVLFQELFAATEALAAGREPELAPVVPYARYLAWLQEQDFDASAPYWKAALADFNAPTPLPGAPAREAAGPAANPTRRNLVLSETRTAALQAFARAQGLTMNTLVQGAWALLLSRCSGEEKVVFGAVRACRHGSVPGAENIVGLLINTVPVCVPVPANARVAGWLGGLRQQWVDLRAHEHVPLSSLRKWCAVPSGAPFFETIVSYQDPSWDVALRRQGGSWAQRSFATHNHTNQALALDVAGGPSLQLTLSYDAARFTAPAIDRMLGHVATLLDGMAAHPDRTLAEMPLLTAAEKHLLLHDWNFHPVDFEKDLCVHHLVEEQAARAPQALAVADDHGQLTYGELNARATELARHLHRLGTGPGMFVGVCLEPSVNLVVALLAVLKAGGAYVPLDPAYPEERRDFLIQDAGLKILLTQRKLAGHFAASGVHCVSIDGPLPAAATDGDAPAVLVSPEHPAYLIYTSGSTGQPKGVVIRHLSLANLVAWHRDTYEVTPADRATQIASPAFDACVWELWPYLASGASVHIPSGDARCAPASVVRWLADRRITLSFLPTPLAEAVMDETWPAETSLRAILTGGDRLRRWPGVRLPCLLFNHYGPTECTVLATSCVVPPAGAGAPAIGRAMANTEVYVLDRHRRLLPVGAPGELYLGGIGLAEGYHRRPELTDEKFVPHPFQTAGSRLYRTGDLVRWREDGQLEYLGRADEQIKIRGHRIEPGEIEAALSRHPAVRECLVVCRQEEHGEARLVGYLLAKPGVARPNAAELAEFLHHRLPAYMVPGAYVTLDSWPLTTHGKIDRRQLPEPAASQAAGGPSLAPRPGLESIIADTWREVLGRQDLNTADDFFLVGGHSLRAAQVVSRLNAALGLSLSVRHLFDHSTIASLAAVIGPLAKSPAAPGRREIAQRC